MRARVASGLSRRSTAKPSRLRDRDERRLLPGLLLDRPPAGNHAAGGTLLTAQRQQVLAAQEVLGNRWVSQRLAEERHVDEVTNGEQRESFTVRAAIRRAPGRDRPVPAPARAAVTTADSVDGGSERVEVEKEGPGRVSVSLTDAIAPTLGFASGVTRGNPALTAGEFGLTSWSANVKNAAATADPAAKTFAVTADVDCPILWEVHSLGKKDLPNATSPHLHEGNWRTAVSDLTPDLSSDNGRPPRTKFWAKDLTERHELYHAKDFQKYGKAAFDLAQTWLGGQTATTEAGAVAKAKKVSDRMVASIRTTMLPRAEHRAYGDGAPDYVTRSHKIQVNGDAELYPKKK